MAVRTWKQLGEGRWGVTRVGGSWKGEWELRMGGSWYMRPQF